MRVRVEASLASDSLFEQIVCATDTGTHPFPTQDERLICNRGISPQAGIGARETARGQVIDGEARLTLQASELGEGDAHPGSDSREAIVIEGWTGRWVLPFAEMGREGSRGEAIDHEGSLAPEREL